MKRTITIVMATIYCAIGAFAIADEDDDYAHPEGEDEWGMAYEVREVPTEMRGLLDSNGEYVMESFIDRTIRRGEQECWVFQQIPAAGTITNCPQVIEVQLRYTCDGNDQYNARLPIELIDITPPNIAIQMVADEDPHTCYAQVPRYLSTATVVPIVTATDACGVQKDVRLNGEPYQVGVPLTETGLYFLTVSAEDDSGNVRQDGVTFEIRERPCYDAVAVVESLTCSDGLLSGTVWIAADEFAPEDVYYDSAMMLMRAPDGTYMDQVVSLEPSYMNNCWGGYDFSAGVIGCPDHLIFAGLGLSNGLIEFDWSTGSDSSASSNAQQSMLDLMNNCDGWGGAPGSGSNNPPGSQPPPPTCNAHHHYYPTTPQICDPPSTPAQGGCLPNTGTISLYSASEHISGGANSSAASAGHNQNCTTGPNHCGTKFGSAWRIVRFTGNCCDCSVTFTGDSNIKAEVDVGVGGTHYYVVGSVAGTISFDAPCDYQSASVTASLLSSTVPDVNIPASPTVTQNATASLNCTVEGCQTYYFLVNTSVFISTIADAEHGSWCDVYVNLESPGTNFNTTATKTTCTQ